MSNAKNNQNRILKQEQEAHDTLYHNLAAQSSEDSLSWDEYRSTRCVPPHKGGPIYGLDCQILLDRIEEYLKKSNQDIRVLDYGCGLEALGVLVAEKGFKVDGFDISSEAVDGAARWARANGVEERATFTVANAQELPYEDDTFDLVIGKAVLHHTIKYEGGGDELYRVMKPGGIALFLEGAATNPLIRLARVFTIKDELGDVPLTVTNIRQLGRKFNKIDIEGYFLLYMLKRFGYETYDEALEQRRRNRFGNTRLYEKLLSWFLAVDNLVVNRKPYAKAIAGRYLLEVRK